MNWLINTHTGIAIISAALPFLVMVFGTLTKSYTDQSAKSFRNPIKALALSKEVLDRTLWAIRLVYPSQVLDQRGEYRQESNAEWRQNAGWRFSDYGMVLLGTYESSGADVIIAHYKNATIVSVRGTSDLWDLIRDCFAWKTEAPLGGKVHSGFMSDARLLFYSLDLKSALQVAASNGRDIVISGHSLGAATAIELSALCEEHRIPIKACIALCAPRSSDLLHASLVMSSLGSRLFRCTFSRDIVAMLPPVFWGYRHAGPTHYFDGKGEYHRALTTGYRTIDLIGSTFRDLIQLRLFSDLAGYHNAEAVTDLVRLHADRILGKSGKDE